MEIVNDYVTRALIADNRGGLNIDKVFRDKLKDKHVRLKQAGDGLKRSPPASYSALSSAKGLAMG